MAKNVFKKIFFELTMALATLTTSCAKSEESQSSFEKGDLNPVTLRALKVEDSVSMAISMVEYNLEEAGFETVEGFASNGEQTFSGIIYTDFCDAVTSENGTKYYQAGFFQITSDVNGAPALLTPELVANEDKPFMLKDGGGNEFILTLTIPAFDSFSYVYADWYNICKRVGEYVLEVKSLPNEKSNYDYDISCYSYDTNKWLFKSDEDILSFNVSAVGLYSDYTKAYLKSTEAFRELTDIQNKNSVHAEASTYCIVSGDLINSIVFSGQDATINGMSLTSLLSQQSKLKKTQVLSITPAGVQVVDTAEGAKLRVEKGIMGIITNTLAIAGSVSVIVATWGAATPIAAAAIITAGSGIVYSVCNLAESIQDVVYGAQGDVETKSVNLLRDAFCKVIGDEEAGTTAYNIWGISNLIVSALIMPINAAITLNQSLSGAKIALKITRAVGTKIIEGAVVGLASTGIGLVTGDLVYKLTGGNKVATAYAKDFSTLCSAFAIGYGLEILDRKIDFSGVGKYDYLRNRRREDPNFEKAAQNARSKGTQQLKKEALDDIISGKTQPEDYGFDMTNPDDRRIVEFALREGRWPSYADGDGMQAEAAHAVDVNIIKQAYYEGKITEEEALRMIGDPDNMILTSHGCHFNDLHHGAWTHQTDYHIVIARRPQIKDIVLAYLKSCGLETI